MYLPGAANRGRSRSVEALVGRAAVWVARCWGNKRWNWTHNTEFVTAKIALEGTSNLLGSQVLRRLVGKD
jgi:hypothetical protein